MTWSTDLAVRRCVRCGGFVLAGQCGGVPAAVDPGRLELDAYRLALMAGRRTYRLTRKPSGAPWRLQDDVAAWDSRLERLGAHGCLNAPLEAIPVSPDPSVGAVGIADGSTRPAAPVSPRFDLGDDNEATRPGRMDVADSGSADAGGCGDQRHSWLARYCARCREPIGFECREGIQRGEYWDLVLHTRCGEFDAEYRCRH